MIVEFVGEPKVGKSTASIRFASGYAKPKDGVFVIIDVTPGMESYPIFIKELKGGYSPFSDVENEVDGNLYYNVNSLEEVRDVVRMVIKQDVIKAVVIDSSDYLLQMAVEEYLKKTGHRSVYPPTEWRVVRQKVIDLFILMVKRKDLLIVFTSPVKDEYKDVYDGKEVKSMKTGRKIPAGFEKLSYIVDVRIGIGVDNRTMQRYYKVMLSRFFDVISTDVEDLKYYGNDINFEVLTKLMLGEMKEVKK